MTERTHVLHLSYKARNGRRMGHGFPITAKQATDPETRAAMITEQSAMLDARRYRLVNWTITEIEPVEAP